MNPTQNELIEIVKTIRGYGTRLLDNLTQKQLVWIPENSQGRTILNYFAHILNAEIYWLHHMDDKTLNYVGKEATFEDGKKLYIDLQEHLIQKIQKADSDDFKFKIPIFEIDKIIQKGSLGWMIWRTSMHSIHHFAQIAYIRHTLGNPPNEDSHFSWSKVMDKLVALAHGNIIQKN